MNIELAYRIGFEDAIYGNVAMPFEGWDTVKETLSYLKGYYAGKAFIKRT